MYVFEYYILHRRLDGNFENRLIMYDGWWMNYVNSEHLH